MGKDTKGASAESAYNSNPVVKPDDDLLGFNRSCIPTLVDIIEQQGTPYTVAVYGPQGSGKTSLLRLTQQALEDKGHETIWIGPGKYSQAENVRKALVGSVYAGLKTRIQVKTLSKQLRETGTLSAEVLDGLSHAGNPEAEIEQLFSTHPTSKDPFEERFTSLLDQLLEEGKRLVIFMDDLDRCSPQVLMEATNAIKLYLDMPRSVFVISASPDITERGVHRRFREHIPKEGRALEKPDKGKEANIPEVGPALVGGRDCIEEIVQLSFPLPEPERQDLEGFIVVNAGKLGLKDDYKGWRPDLVNIVIAAAGSNPRNIKRLLASTHLCSRMAEAKGKKPQGETLLKLAKVCAMTFGLSDSELRALRRCPSLAWPRSTEAQRGDKTAGESGQSSESRSEKTQPQQGYGIGSWLSIQRLWKLGPRIESTGEFEELLRLTSGTTGLKTALSDEEELLDLMLKDDERIPEAIAREIRGFKDEIGDYLNFFIYSVQNPQVDAIVRANSASVLGRLKQSTPEVIEALVAALQDGSKRVRVSAAYALGEVGQYPPETIDALIPALRNEDPASHLRAVSALSQGGPPSPEGKTVLVYTPQKGEPEVRRDVTEPRDKRAEPSPELTRSPFSTSNDETSDVSNDDTEAVKSEQSLPEAISARISDLKEKSSSAHQPSAPGVSAPEKSSPDAVSTLLLALENRNPDVRMNAATDLGEFGQALPEIMNALVSALRDRNGGVRWRAAMAVRKLGQSSREETLRCLQDKLGGEEDVEVRERIQSVINDLTEN
jgi:HEAT repeat protein